MNVYFYTLGCKVNQYETQAMMRLMKEAGHTTAVYHPDRVGDDAVIVINSCTVTGESNRKLRQLLRRLRRAHREAVLVLTGCLPQAFPDEAAALTEADIVMGNACRRDLPRLVEAFLRSSSRTVAIPPHERTIEPLRIDDFEERTRAFVKIEDGCDRFCSYCIIPYARGRVRSRELSDMVEELRGLVRRGYAEVVLTGINLTAYGKGTDLTLADAVDAACAVDGIERVRLGSLEPDHLTDEMIARLQAQPKLCPQFHVSLQSGSDAVLRRMNRHYTAEEYRMVCDKLKAAFDGTTLTTDVMVGFPGETEELFEESLTFVNSIGFSKVHVFPYSPREGTKAAAMPDQIPTAEKARRAKIMGTACEETRRRLMSALVGSVQEILCETRTDDNGTLGYTKGYYPCRLQGVFDAGQTVVARIVAVDGDRLQAECMQPKEEETL